MQQFLWNHAVKRATHQRPPLAWPQELVGRNGEEEFEKIAVEIRVAFPVARIRRWRITGKLTSQGFESVEIVLEARSCAEEMESLWVSTDCI